MRMWKKIDIKNLKGTGNIHYDYLSVYLDLIYGYPSFDLAQKVCSKYLNYPILRWRSLFTEVNQALAQKDKRLDITLKKFTTVPHLSAKIDQNTILLHYRHTRTVQIRYYIIDLEVVFSMNPFMKEESNKFGIVKPSHQEEFKLDKNSETLAVAIHKDFVHKNCLIDIVDPKTNTSVSLYHFNCNIIVNVYENIGNLDVIHAETGKPVPKVSQILLKFDYF
mgnify:CR=1 FL=1